MAKPQPQPAAEAKHTKEQFINSTKYAANKDVLNALLQQDKTYTAEQVDQKIKAFLEKEAK